MDGSSCVLVSGATVVGPAGAMRTDVHARRCARCCDCPVVSNRIPSQCLAFRYCCFRSKPALLATAPRRVVLPRRLYGLYGLYDRSQDFLNRKLSENLVINALRVKKGTAPLDVHSHY